MATYAQLAAEQWWGREIVTPAMGWLGDELCRRTDRPRVAAGTKGDNRHLRGAHRSQEWILRSAYCTNRTYTVQANLTAEQTRWVAGFDFTPASTQQMIAQCQRIYAAMKAGRLDEVVEFYGNVNGDQVVDGWDNLRDRAASSDSSHLWHWHISIDRRHCNNQQLMERILAVVLGLPEEDDMSAAAEDQIKSVFNGMFYGGNSMGRTVDPDGAGARGAGNSLVVKLDYLMLMVDALATRAGMTAADLDRVRSAAREGSVSAADDLIAAVVAGLPAGALTAEDVERAVRDAFAGGLAPNTAAQG